MAALMGGSSAAAVGDKSLRAKPTQNPAFCPCNCATPSSPVSPPPLEYLHEDWLQCVLHCDIKSSNVMLDDQFNARVGDSASMHGRPPEAGEDNSDGRRARLHGPRVTPHRKGNEGIRRLQLRHPVSGGCMWATAPECTSHQQGGCDASAPSAACHREQPPLERGGSKTSAVVITCSLKRRGI